MNSKIKSDPRREEVYGMSVVVTCVDRCGRDEGDKQVLALRFSLSLIAVFSATGVGLNVARALFESCHSTAHGRPMFGNYR